MNGTVELAERYLRANYRNCVRLTEPTLGEAAQTLRKRAFPDLHLPLHFFFIKSSRRRCMQFLNGNEGVVILDQGEAALMTILDSLVMNPRAGTIQAMLVLQAAFAEAFRHSGSFDRSLVCAMRLAGSTELLSVLTQDVSTRNAGRFLEQFLLLHEMGHFSYDTDQPFVKPVREIVADKLEQHCLSNLGFITQLGEGQSLPLDLETSAGTDPEAREVLIAQLREHVEHTRENTEVIREASCDFIAALGLLSSYSGVNAFDENAVPKTNLSGRAIGDLLMIALRASRFLVVGEFVRQAASRIAEGDDPSRLGQPYSQSVARQNVVTNLLLALFERVLEVWQIAAEEKFDTSVLLKGFRGQVEVFNSRSADVLFQAVEQIGMLYRDPDAFAGELLLAKASARSRSHDGEHDVNMAIDAALADVPF